MERYFLLAVTLFFIVLSIFTNREALFLTLFSKVIYSQLLLWRYILLFHSILLKKKYLNREEDITRILEVNVT